MFGSPLTTVPWPARAIHGSVMVCNLHTTRTGRCATRIILGDQSNTIRGGSRISETGVRAQNPIHPHKNLNFIYEKK